MANDEPGEVLEVPPSFGKVSLDLFNLLAVFVDVEERNAADADGEQPFDISVGQLTEQLPAEGLEAVEHGGGDRLVGPAVFDLFVEAFFDEDAFQRAAVQFVPEVLLLQFQFPLEDAQELGRVFSQNFRNGHLDRPVVPDDDDAAGDVDLAIREGIERIHQLIGADTAGGFDFDLDLFGGEIVDGLDPDFALARGVFD